jgi:plastocyanin
VVRGLISFNRSARLYRRMGVVMAAAFAAFALAACGSSNDNGDDTSEDTGAAASTTGATGGGGAAETVKIGESEFKLTPADVSVKPGEVTFEATNDGATTHNLEVEGPGEEQTTEDIAPGESASITVDMSKPGTYEMYCAIDSHREQGMEGEITVE